MAWPMIALAVANAYQSNQQSKQAAKSTRAYPFHQFLPKQMREPAVAEALKNLDLLQKFSEEGETPAEQLMHRDERNRTIRDFDRLSNIMAVQLAQSGAPSSSKADERYRMLSGSLLNALTTLDTQRLSVLRSKQIEPMQMAVGNIAGLSGRGTLVSAPGPGLNPAMQAAGSFAGQLASNWMSRAPTTTQPAAGYQGQGYMDYNTQSYPESAQPTPQYGNQTAYS